ncbi:lyase family protein [Curvibacter sp. RS43]|uniref:lyase family protein n=1 Tax=Curvibacter microcysteis TaxID=3026419 RepID=UPI00235E4732|nr:lyase family protein [Curvibacter sp. RS43]MDD0812836.1 lyase family protein [Curvibacter sp. RS43]
MPFDAVLTSAEGGVLFDASAMVQRLLDVEAALAWAQVDCGQMDRQQAASIADACHVEQFDVADLLREARRSGSLVVPLVEQLIKRVAARDPQAAKHVHASSTSQDIIDTAMVLATQEALSLIERDLSALIDALLVLARTHVAQPILARTLMQPAAVQPFGLKVMNWVQPLRRCRAALRVSSSRALVLQFGGPVGTFGHADPRERDLVLALGRRLGLPVPDGAWHTQRDEWARLGCELAVLCGSCGKLARDWALMSQLEVGELDWGGLPGTGASSAMPHKRNPVAALIGITSATRAPLRAAGVLLGMVQEHERALGAWHVELAEWGGLVQAAAGAVSALSIAARGLRINGQQMRQHIHSQKGLIFSQPVTEFLSQIIGRQVAKELVAVACEECRVTDQQLGTLLLERLGRVDGWDSKFNDALIGLFDVDALTTSMAPYIEPAIGSALSELQSTVITEGVE